MNYRKEFEKDYWNSNSVTQDIDTASKYWRKYGAWLETKLTERDKEIKRLNTILDDLRHEKQTATNLKRRQR
jgi:hypothetical protein